jgi:hypothetical protein
MSCHGQSHNHKEEYARVVDTLNVVTAHGLRLAANSEDGRVGLGRDRRGVVVVAVCGRSAARLNLSKAAIGHGVCEVRVRIHSIVVGLDTIGVVDGEF